MIKAMIFDLDVTLVQTERLKPVAPKTCLVIEDSPSGVKAAIDAGMHCVAVTTSFIQESTHTQHLLPEGHIVDEPSRLSSVVAHVIEHIRLQAVTI